VAAGELNGRAGWAWPSLIPLAPPRPYVLGNGEVTFQSHVNYFTVLHSSPVDWKALTCMGNRKKGAGIATLARRLGQRRWPRRLALGTGGALAPPKSGRWTPFRLASRAACRRKLRARRGRGIIRGPCNGGAKAPPSLRGEKSGSIHRRTNRFHAKRPCRLQSARALCVSCFDFFTPSEPRGGGPTHRVI